ncbi:hypothetical protein BJ741DRAFT_714521 [Chytriomyces cf. hyalinus JEL632]|nr:hypothetical protein BJ741DRAFT_714521 [Chytriomyces cf. hyalinus JEL632]
MLDPPTLIQLQMYPKEATMSSLKPLPALASAATFAEFKRNLLNKCGSTYGSTRRSTSRNLKEQPPNAVSTHSLTDFEVEQLRQVEAAEEAARERWIAKLEAATALENALTNDDRPDAPTNAGALQAICGASQAAANAYEPFDDRIIMTAEGTYYQEDGCDALHDVARVVNGMYHMTPLVQLSVQKAASANWIAACSNKATPDCPILLATRCYSKLKMIMHPDDLAQAMSMEADALNVSSANISVGEDADAESSMEVEAVQQRAPVHALMSHDSHSSDPF